MATELSTWEEAVNKILELLEQIKENTTPAEDDDNP